MDEVHIEKHVFLQWIFFHFGLGVEVYHGVLSVLYFVDFVEISQLVVPAIKQEKCHELRLTRMFADVRGFQQSF